MTSLEEIKRNVSKELDEFKLRFASSVKSNVPLLNIITRYLLKQKGKQIRPLFVFLSAGMMGKINDSTYRAATLIELLHTATLVHDDVVDEAHERRGFLTLNALWKNKIAVLVGDFLLAKGLLVSLESEDYRLLRIVTEAVREMSEGELLQLEKARKLNVSEEVYFEIIRKKTATLIASCCATGVASVCDDKETIETAWKIGELAGIAFQLKDDLFEFENTLTTGKTKGLDIKDRKLTLPLIYTLSQVSLLQRKKLINIVKNHNTNPVKVKELVKIVSETGGINYATIKMNEYRQKAIDLLNSRFNSNVHKENLAALIDFTINRSV